MSILCYVNDKIPLEEIRSKYIKKGYFVCQGYDDEIMEILNDEQIEGIIRDIMEYDIGYNVSNSYDDLVHAKENH